MFQKYLITKDKFNYNFNNFANATNFENVINGRKGAVICDINNNIIPLVRTTTKYNNPCQQFNEIHYKLINQIQQLTNNTNIKFNNALVEIYNNEYSSMGYHTDQAIDLENNSYICLFSIYNNNTNSNIRSLIIKNKLTNIEEEIILEYNSIIIFSTEINKQYLHKIVLKNIDKKNTNKQWLGITFRLSKTFIKFINEIPYFININNKEIIHHLYLANDEEKNLFINYKSQENKLTNFVYPLIFYTVNPSDLIK